MFLRASPVQYNVCYTLISVLVNYFVKRCFKRYIDTILCAQYLCGILIECSVLGQLLVIFPTYH